VIRLIYETLTRCLADWCEILKLPYPRIYYRIKNNWDSVRAFETSFIMQKDRYTLMAVHSNKDIRKLVKDLLREGWSIVSRSKHFKIRSPGGRLVSISSTPSCGYMVENVKRDVQKIKDIENGSVIGNSTISIG
jgi:hypothetical protein